MDNNIYEHAKHHHSCFQYHQGQEFEILLRIKKKNFFFSTQTNTKYTITKHYRDVLDENRMKCFISQAYISCFVFKFSDVEKK